LRKRTDARLVCEPRHPSWFTPEAERLFADHRIARVAADPAPVPGAEEHGGWAGLRYARLHGSPDMYRSTYDVAALRELATVALAAGVEIWTIFDNTMTGAATANALAMWELVN
jgi:uncharacterized protein YecE (DUF72 family)